MTQIQPNFLSPIGFSFVLTKTPKVDFFIQRATVPGVSLGVIQRPMPLGTPVTEPGNVVFEPLTLNFKINEDMTNYLEIFNWMIELGTPDSSEQFVNTKYDARLIILSATRNPIMDISFEDVFPTSLSPISMDTAQDDVQYLDADVSFSFDRMYFNTI